MTFAWQSPHNSCGALPTTLGTKEFLHQTVVKQDLMCRLQQLEGNIIWQYMAIWHAKAKRRCVKIVKRKEQKFSWNPSWSLMSHDATWCHVWFHVGLHRWRARKSAFLRCFAWRCHQCWEITLSCTMLDKMCVGQADSKISRCSRCSSCSRCTPAGILPKHSRWTTWPVRGVTVDEVSSCPASGLAIHGMLWKPHILVAIRGILRSMKLSGETRWPMLCQGNSAAPYSIFTILYIILHPFWVNTIFYSIGEGQDSVIKKQQEETPVG